jgi:hypothetical protein
MYAALRQELRFGPYRIPRCRIGQQVECLIRGEVRVVGLSDAPKRWPIGEKDGRHELIVYRGLAEAVHLERQEAIAAHWGVPVETVAGWQRALHPATFQRSEAEVPAFSFADLWTTPNQRQFSLLDMIFWMFWIAVLSALLRLMYGHTQISDKWHIATTCLAASVTLAAAWGYANKIRSEAGVAFRIGFVVAAGFVGLLLLFRLSDAGFSGLELVALALGNVATSLAGLKIGSR